VRCSAGDLRNARKRPASPHQGMSVALSARSRYPVARWLRLLRVGAGNASPLRFGEFRAARRVDTFCRREPGHDLPSPDRRPFAVVARDRRRAGRRDPRPAASDPGTATSDQPAALQRHGPDHPRRAVHRVRTVMAAPGHVDRAAQVVATVVTVALLPTAGSGASPAHPPTAFGSSSSATVPARVSRRRPATRGRWDRFRGLRLRSG